MPTSSTFISIVPNITTYSIIPSYFYQPTSSMVMWMLSQPHTTGMRACRLAKLDSHKERSEYFADHGETTRINLNDRHYDRLEDPLRHHASICVFAVATLMPMGLSSRRMLASPRVMLGGCHLCDEREWKKQNRTKGRGRYKDRTHSSGSLVNQSLISASTITYSMAYRVFHT